MASADGQIKVLKTKNGYINAHGNETYDIDEALKIYDGNFRFTEAYDAYIQLGFDNPELRRENITWEVIQLSYDSRLGAIEQSCMDFGKSYTDALIIASTEFRRYSLDNYKNFINYMNNLNKKIIEFYKLNPIDETVVIDGVDKNLHKTARKEKCESEYIIQDYYHETGKITKYSFPLNNPHVERYFTFNKSKIDYYNNWQNEGLINYLKPVLEKRLKENGLDAYKLIRENNGTLEIYFSNVTRNIIEFIGEAIRYYYSTKEMHITRMFGSYVILQKLDGKLQAVCATPIPIKYCPLMYKLLKEISGNYADELINALNTNDLKKQEECMCTLINETVIKSGYFDTNRPLNSCEANVLFGASETMASAFKNGLIDAAVIVSNNLGTIITTSDENTQGAVKRMTGLFYTTPDPKIMKTAEESSIIPVFPYSAKIDQLEGVKEAIRRGFKRIAVSVAANDNFLHKELKELEKDGIKIYKFGLCSTGIAKETAEIMKDNADVIWSCASKHVAEIIEPHAIAQVGIKIPVHIMSKEGWEIIKNHLCELNSKDSALNIELQQGEDKPIFLNKNGDIQVLQKRHIKKCNNCPNPCV